MYEGITIEPPTPLLSESQPNELFTNSFCTAATTAVPQADNPSSSSSLTSFSSKPDTVRLANNCCDGKRSSLGADSTQGHYMDALEKVHFYCYQKEYIKVFRIYYHNSLLFLIILYYIYGSFMFYSTNQIATAAVVVVYLEIAHPVENDEALNQWQAVQESRSLARVYQQEGHRKVRSIWRKILRHKKYPEIKCIL